HRTVEEKAGNVFATAIGKDGIDVATRERAQQQALGGDGQLRRRLHGRRRDSSRNRQDQGARGLTPRVAAIETCGRRRASMSAQQELTERIRSIVSLDPRVT